MVDQEEDLIEDVMVDVNEREEEEVGAEERKKTTEPGDDKMLVVKD